MENIRQKLIENIHNDKKYIRIGLKFNPFPKSGTTNINGGDHNIEQLNIIDDEVASQITNFLAEAFSENPSDPEDKFITAVILGDYGVGKTQHLMFIKYLLETLDSSVKPYVVYIDNPGVNLSELIGSILSKIGEESFKKYLWGVIINQIKTNPIYKLRLEPFEYKGIALFDNEVTNPYDEINLISYKSFLDTWTRYIGNLRKRKEFNEILKGLILEIFYEKYNDNALSNYFYELVAANFGINNTWESLSSGDNKFLQNKEVKIIQSIVRLVKEQGYTDFFILADEFEDITKGRLNKKQVDNYIYNLRTLLDQQREWVLFFAMTGLALKQFESINPAFADRIKSRVIRLKPFNEEQGIKVIIQYLAAARIKEEDKNNIYPFTEKAVSLVIDKTNGSPRRFLKTIYYVLELFVKSNLEIIDEEFINNNLDSETIP